MNKISTIKGVVGFVCGTGASIIIGNAVKIHTPADTGKLAKIFIKAGDLAISSMLADKVSAYVHEQIDEIVASVTGTIIVEEKVGEKGEPSKDA